VNFKYRTEGWTQPIRMRRKEAKYRVLAGTNNLLSNPASRCTVDSFQSIFVRNGNIKIPTKKHIRMILLMTTAFSQLYLLFCLSKQAVHFSGSSENLYQTTRCHI